MHQKFTLKNGARLILVPQQNTAAVTVLILFRVGSRYETGNINGVSHFLEHMMFKGTRRRPTTSHISRELDSVGAEYNAFTGKDYTGYYIKIEARHLLKALDMLEDMLYHSKFDEEEFNRERKVIHEEIHMYRDNPMMRVEELIEEEIFAGNTLGWPIAGTEETMNGIAHANLVNYYKTYYIPKRTVIAVAGNQPPETYDIVKKLFSKPPKRSLSLPREFKNFYPASLERQGAAVYPALLRSKGAVVVHKSSQPPRVKIEYKDTEQAQLALGWPAYKYLDKRLPALSVLSTILGGTMSSRLFISVRERKGLAYYVRTGVDVYEDTGSFQVRAGLARGRLEEALETIMDELRKIKRSGITSEELHRAKENIRGKLAIELEESSEIASFYGRQELFTNKTLTPEEKVSRILKVTREEVKVVVNDIIRQDRLSMATIGPYKDDAPFIKFLKL